MRTKLCAPRERVPLANASVRGTRREPDPRDHLLSSFLFFFSLLFGMPVLSGGCCRFPRRTRSFLARSSYEIYTCNPRRSLTRLRTFRLLCRPVFRNRGHPLKPMASKTSPKQWERRPKTLRHRSVWGPDVLTVSLPHVAPIDRFGAHAERVFAPIFSTPEHTGRKERKKNHHPSTPPPRVPRFLCGVASPSDMTGHSGNRTRRGADTPGGGSATWPRRAGSQEAIH